MSLKDFLKALSYLAFFMAALPFAVMGFLKYCSWVHYILLGY